MSDLQVQEVVVLRSTIGYLASRGVLPHQISPPSGVGIDTSAFKREMREIFSKVGASPNFVGNGPDIVGVSDSEYWLVECKGAGAGKASTQRNNFDRALASVVSYYEHSSPPPNEDLKVYLGLALPGTIPYKRLLLQRVRRPLREALNLWVLLYEPESEDIRVTKPTEEYGFA